MHKTLLHILITSHSHSPASCKLCERDTQMLPLHNTVVPQGRSSPACSNRDERLPFWASCAARLLGYSPEGTDTGQRGWDSQLPSKAYLSWVWKDVTAEGCKTQLDHAFDPGSAITRRSIFRVSSARACFRKRKQPRRLILM